MGATRNTGYLENLIAYDASNNVAIATTAIDNAFKITMGGSVKMTGALSGTSATFSGDLTIDTNTLYVDSTNNRVGIGTTTTTYKLDVSGSGSMINIIGASSGDVSTGFRIGRGATLGAEIYDNPQDNITTFNTTGGLNLRVGGSNRLTISSTGAATFSSSVSATSATFSDTISATKNRSNTAGTVGLKIAPADTVVSFGFRVDSATNSLNLDNSYDNTNLFKISSTGAATFSGNVGIGEAARTTSTLVINNTNAKNELTFGGSEYTNIYSETTSGMQFGIVSSGNSAAIEFLTNNAERMRITSGGNVLVGTTSTTGLATGSSANPGVNIGPGASSFQVNNNSNIYLSKASGYTSNDFTAHFVNGTYVGGISTNGSSTTYATASDYRLKTDLKDFVGIDIVKLLNVYDYQWVLNKSRSFGVLAHELQSVLPDAVTGVKDGEQMQGVDYSKLTPILVKAIQELKAELDILKNR